MRIIIIICSAAARAGFAVLWPTTKKRLSILSHSSTANGGNTQRVCEKQYLILILKCSRCKARPTVAAFLFVCYPPTPPLGPVPERFFLLSGFEAYTYTGTVLKYQEDAALHACRARSACAPSLHRCQYLWRGTFVISWLGEVFWSAPHELFFADTFQRNGTNHHINRFSIYDANWGWPKVCAEL